MNVLQAVCNRSVRLETSRVNPLKGVKSPKEPKGRVRYLKPEEQKRLLDALTIPAYLWSLVLVAIPTGMRRGNLVDMRWDWIDVDNRLITIPRTKNDDPVVLPLNKSALAVQQALPHTDARYFPA